MRYATVITALVLFPAAVLAGPGQATVPGGRTGSMPMHLDPLDAGRGGALHRGANPHANLTPEQHLRVAAQHLAAGRVPQALAVLSRALARYPDSAPLHNLRAAVEQQQGDIGGALSDMEQAVKLAPDNALYRVSRARLYLKFGRDQEALKDLDAAVLLDPDLVPARFNRGTLLANLGREREALADFDRCIEVAPELPAPWFNRGAMHWALGEKEKARSDIRRFLERAQEPSWKKAGEELLRAWDAGGKSAPGEGGRKP